MTGAYAADGKPFAPAKAICLAIKESAEKIGQK
jgi:hypothetical protein